MRLFKLARRFDKVVFVSYGGFDSNSGGHVAGFASELCARGYEVAVCGRDRIEHVHSFGPPAYEFFLNDHLAADPRGVIGFDGRFEPDRTVILCWTPRKYVRRAVAGLLKRWPIPYVVHFEDNEDHLAELRLAEAGAEAEAAEQDKAARGAFLAGAAGATVIEPRLKEILPRGLPSLVLEPGVDFDAFEAPLPPYRRATLLRAVGASPEATVVVYPGNIHRANAGEMAELYRAIALLRLDGRDIVLIKTGKDNETVPAPAGVIALGLVDRPFLVDLIRCADLFIQPGASGPFNDYRLPSKLPEFMAAGRPVILPATNLGLRLRDGMDAMLLYSGAAEEIASHVETILADPILAARLSANAQAFARRTYRWDRQGEKLVGLLNQLPAFQVAGCVGA